MCICQNEARSFFLAKRLQSNRAVDRRFSEAFVPKFARQRLNGPAIRSRDSAIQGEIPPFGISKNFDCHDRRVTLDLNGSGARKMKSDQYVRIFRNSAVAAASMIFCFCGSAGAQCLRYSMDWIQPDPCGFFYPILGTHGMSESGDICGGGGTCGKTQSAHFVWYGQQPIIYLPIPPMFPSGWAVDINSSRQVVGNMAPSGSSFGRAYVHHNGTTVDLGWLPEHFYSEAAGISEDGVACATSWGPFDAKIFIWQNGFVSALNLPLGPRQVAFGISDNHLLCGWMGQADTTFAHAFIHDLKMGRTLDIGTPLPGTTNAQATGVNNLGNACGWSFSECGAQGCLGRRGFFWSQGQVQEIHGFPTLPQVIPKAINDLNSVVGFCSDTTGYSNAFVWKDGVTHRLQDLVQTSLPLDILIASSINNAGQIAAYGGYPDPDGFGTIFVALRMNPIPPLTGDLNCDWQVNVPDLLAVIGAWGPCPSKPPGEPFTETCHADFNDDGVVDHHDIVAVVLNWTS